MAKKQKRRSNGEGSVYQRKDGSWMASATVGIDPKTGKAKRKTFYGKTRKEAVEKMNKTLHEINNGTYIEPSTVTLEQWLNDWLNGRKPYIEESSYLAYENMIKKHINPNMGKVKLKDLKSQDIQNFLNERYEKGRIDGKGGLSPRSVKYIYQTLHAALEKAVKNKPPLILHNPADKDIIELPKRKNSEMQTLTTEKIKKFFEVAKESPYYTAFVVEFYTGLRRGELLGLRWQDIDFNNGTITIRQQVTKGKKGIVIKDTKTDKSKRTITLPNDALEAMKAHKKQQNEQKLFLGPYSEENPDGYHDNGLVFCKSNGEPVYPDYFTKHFQACLKKAGLPKVRFHDGRHTFATLALEAGVELKTVQEMLGHTSISITGDIYSHVTQKMQQEAADKVETALSGCF